MSDTGKEVKDAPSGDHSNENGTKLDKVVNKIAMESNSREGSPDPNKKKSRRKPTVTRKVAADGDGEQEEVTLDGVDAEENATKMIDKMIGQVVEVEESMDTEEVDTVAEDTHLVNGNRKDTTEEDKPQEKDKPNENSEDFVIPEGTIIVQPEAVDEDKDKEFKGPEWKNTKRSTRAVALGMVQCSACNKQINTNLAGAAKRHPVLKVLICKRCYSWYDSAEIEQDEDGMDEQCRWCGDGGNLICCDFCHNAFCKGCIKKNLGRKELSEIIDAGDDAKWHCYVCDPKPLANLISDCTSTLEGIEKALAKGKPEASKKSADTTTTPKAKSTPVAKKSTTPHSKVTPAKHQAKPASKPFIRSPEGFVLPPGAIPVTTVLNSSGNQVIVLQQQIGDKSGVPLKIIPSQKHGQNRAAFNSASEEQLRIIGQAVHNVTRPKTSGMSSSPKPSSRSPMVRYEWEAPINEYNVAQTLDRTLAVTESLRMVMVSLKEDMKKANQMPVTPCLEKKRIVSAKLKRAMGAFKKQVQDIELFCKSTFKTVRSSAVHGAKAKQNPPFPVGMLKNKVQSAKPSPRSKKDVEIIELSSSDEDDVSDVSTKDSKNEASSSKEKKGFSMKLNLGGDSSKLKDARKRKHSDDDKSASDEDQGNNDKKENKKSKTTEDEEKKESLSTDDEPLSERMKKQKEKVESPEKDEAKPDGSSQNKSENKQESEGSDEKKSTSDEVSKNEDIEKVSKEGEDSEKVSEDCEKVSEDGETKSENTKDDGKEDSADKQTEEIKTVKDDEKSGGDEDGSEDKEDEVIEMDIAKHEGEKGDASESEAKKADTSDELNKVEDDVELLIEKDDFDGSPTLGNVKGSRPRSRKDIEAQLELQKQLLDDGESESDNDSPLAVKGSDSSSNDENSSSENDSGGDQDYTPKNSNGRQSRRLQNKNKEQEDRVKLLKKKRKEKDPSLKKKKHKKRDDSDSESESDSEVSKNKRSMKSDKEKRKDGGTKKSSAANRTNKPKKKFSGVNDTNESDSAEDVCDNKIKKKRQVKQSGDGDESDDNKKQKDKKSKKTSKDESVLKKSKNKRKNKEDVKSDSENECDESDDDKKQKDKKSKKTLKDESVLKKSKNKRKNKEDVESDSENEGDDSDDDKKQKDKKSKKTLKDESVLKKSKNKSKKKEDVQSDSENEGNDHSIKKNSKGKSSLSNDESKSKSKSSSVKKEKEKRGSKSHKSKNESDDEENSSNYDSDLEKDIERLAQAPKASKGNKKSKTKNEDEEKSDTTNKDKSSTTNSGKSAMKKKTRKELLNELSSGEEEEDAEDVDEAVEEKQELDMEDEGDRALAALERVWEDMDDAEVPVDVEEGEEMETADERARKALLQDSASSDSADEDIEEMILSKKAKEESKKKKGTDSKGSSAKSSAQVSEDEDGSEVEKRKTRKSNRLLDAKLSENSDDEDSDVVKPSKNKSKKRASDSEYEKDEEEDDEAENEDGGLSDVSSDFDIKPKKKIAKKKKKKGETSSESEVSDDSDSDKGKKSKKGKAKKRKRIKKVSESSNQGSSGNDEDGKGPKKKKIRKLIKDNKLSVDTKSAAKAEEERRTRIKEKQSLYNQVDIEDVNSPTKAKITTKLVLEMDEDKNPVIEVNPKLIRKLKPHQVQAVKFLWDSCIEDLDRLKNEDGAGCILAHCMGLGKTLSVITFVHTIMSNYKLTGVERCMVVCPLNTVLNWVNEWTKWLDKKDQLDVYELASCKAGWARCDMLQEWQDEGGILIIGYEMYRNLSTCKNIRKKKQKDILTKTLVDPGPDIVVCDEGHILKNDASALSKAMNNIRTRRRICLTGTPLQNNLAEYHCMVDFVKPKLLGTRKEFMNRFVNPIKNGQCSDSTVQDVKLMKKRAHILHDMLGGSVQRKDYSALTKFLPPKQEYVISIRLSEVQIELYEKYLNRVGHGPLDGEKLRSAQLFSDYQALMRIWTHPWILKLQEIREIEKRYNQEDSEDSMFDDDSMDDFLDDDVTTDDSDKEISLGSSSDNGSIQSEKKRYRKGGKTRAARKAKEKDEDEDEGKKSKKGEVVKKWKSSSRGGSRPDTPLESLETNVSNSVSSEWWAEHVTEDDKYNIDISGKITLLAEVLRMSEAIGDKVLVFSQSLLSLNLIEDFLAKWDKQDENEENPIAGTMDWCKGLDYFRMDGSTSAQYRKLHADTFNAPENARARLFLISTRAGSLGTNLVGANRVIIFDASWNPSHDTQSIFRVYRFGQTKPTYIYRFLAQGTMEEKIYERQVTKQSLAQRVVDEHQIERHFSTADLSELYNFKPEKLEDSDPETVYVLPKDRMLADMLTEQKAWIVKYHEHDSLLENQIEDTLTDEERKAAWEEYEQEKKMGYRVRAPTMAQNTNQFIQHYNMQQQMYGASNVMQQQAAPNYSVTQIEELAKSIYAANPGISQDDLRKRVQTYVQHQQIQFYRRQQEIMQRQDMTWLQHYTGADAMGQRPNPAGQNYSMLLQNMGRSASASNLAPAHGPGTVSSAALPQSSSASHLQSLLTGKVVQQKK